MQSGDSETAGPSLATNRSAHRDGRRRTSSYERRHDTSLASRVCLQGKTNMDKCRIIFSAVAAVALFVIQASAGDKPMTHVEAALAACLTSHITPDQDVKLDPTQLLMRLIDQCRGQETAYQTECLAGPLPKADPGDKAGDVCSFTGIVFNSAIIDATVKRRQ